MPESSRKFEIVEGRLLFFFFFLASSSGDLVVRVGSCSISGNLCKE